MSLILDRCYFCLHRKAKHVVEDQGDVFHLCSGCKEQMDEALSNVGKNVLELPRQNPSDICLQCGLCCVALAARTDEGETRKFLEQANATGRHPKNVTMDQFCTLRESPPYRGELVMNFPCVYLKGSVLDYVACRGYDLDRPAVCGSYLCKIAVQYKLGLISLGEAKFSLRSSFMTGDVTVFNWNQGDVSPDEERINILMQVASHIDRVKEAGVPEDHWEWAAAAFLTPEYLPSSDYARSWLNMHLFAVDREDFRLEAYVEPEIIEGWSEAQRDAASHVMEMVLRDIRAYFVRAEHLVTKEEDDGQAGGDTAEGEGGAEREEAAAEVEAEGGDSSDDLDQRGRGGVPSGGLDPRGPREGEGSEPAEDAQAEPNLHLASGSGRGPEPADEEGGEGRADPVSADELVDMLGLVLEYEKHPSVEELMTLSPEEREEVSAWCIDVHLEASDNELDPPVGPAPKCLRDILPEGCHYKTWRLDRDDQEGGEAPGQDS